MVDKNTQLTQLMLEYPSLVKIFKPYTFEYLTNDQLTVGDVAQSNKLDTEGFVKETNELIKFEPSRNLAQKDLSELASIVDEKYFEELLDELPVLDIYVKKFISKTDTDGEGVQEKFTELYGLTKEYINFSKKTLHPLIKESNDNQVAVKAQIKNRNLIKDKVLTTLRDLREKTNDYVVIDNNADNQFLYNRMYTIEDTILDMILVEDNVYKKATE